MKNIKIYGLLIIIAAMLGCTDLEEEPVGVLAPEGFFKTESDVEAAIFGAYGRIASERLYGRKLVLALQLRGDMCDIGDRGTPARRQQINDFNSDANNGMTAAIWPRAYDVISACNAAIAGAGLISTDDATRNRLIAEATFTRAFMYYHLVRLYGDIPYLDAFISDPGSVVDISKTAASTVYTNLKSDLDFCIANLPMEHPDNVRTRPSKGTAYTMLADIHLTLEEWQEAFNNAKWVIDNKAALGYDLVADFQDLFDGSMHDGMAEHIFAVDFLGQLRGGSGENDDLMGPITGIRGGDNQGWSVSVPSIKVYNGWNSRDYRKKVSFNDSTLVGGVLTPYTEYQRVQRPHQAKFDRFPGQSDANTRYSDHNYVCFRYAEVLLIAAEAQNELSGADDALDYINEVRARARNWAGTTTDFPADVASGLTQAQFRDTIMDERRLELAFEFKRWYDIKRRQLGEAVFTDTLTSLEPHENFNDNKYLLALPDDELKRNPNLLPQNPGY